MIIITTLSLTCFFNVFFVDKEDHFLQNTPVTPWVCGGRFFWNAPKIRGPKSAGGL
jgi:hypothetical protein